MDVMRARAEARGCQPCLTYQGGSGTETRIDGILTDPRVASLVQDEMVIKKPGLPGHSLLRVDISLDISRWNCTPRAPPMRVTGFGRNASRGHRRSVGRSGCPILMSYIHIYGERERGGGGLTTWRGRSCRDVRAARARPLGVSGVAPGDDRNDQQASRKEQKLP